MQCLRPQSILATYLGMVDTGEGSKVGISFPRPSYPLSFIPHVNTIPLLESAILNYSPSFRSSMNTLSSDGVVDLLL